MKTLTLKEMLKERGYSKKDMKKFYETKESLANMNVRLTIEAWEQMDKEGMDRRGV